MNAQTQNPETQKIVIEKLIAKIDVSDSDYERAHERYRDLSDWFGSDKAITSRYYPHIYPQGSFRLGTVVRPINKDDAFDLDVGCRLRRGITKATHSQASIKGLIRQDLESYRVARRIMEELEEKNRCWCLQYSDHLNFHMDIVPTIPEDDTGRMEIAKALERGGRVESSARNIADYTGAITDRRHPQYREICSNWHVSNSEGHAQWFEEKMYSSGWLQRMMEKAIKVDELPVYKRRTPLQQCVQVLKRHRDIMFQDRSELKPISIIITTLAAQAYNGEQDVASAVQNVLAQMGDFVNDSFPRVPDPTNPKVDFADKWMLDPRLEECFNEWLAQAQNDLCYFELTDDPDKIMEKAVTRFGVTLDADDLRRHLGMPLGAVLSGGSGLAVTTPTRAVDHRGGGKFGSHGDGGVSNCVRPHGSKFG